MKTNEQIEYFKKITKGHSMQEVADMFYEKYGVRLTINQVKYYRSKYKLKSGITGYFSKGQKPHNYKPIGYEFIDKSNGYTFIKVAEPNTFVQKQRYVYEQYYGEIPDGYSVVFLNQNKTDFSIDNLMLVKSKDKLTCKNKNLFSTNKELTKVGLLTASLINKTAELRKEDN